MSKKYIDQQVKIYDIEFPNKGVGEWEGGRVVVKNTLPGQTVLADIKKKRKQYEGYLKGVIEKADYEVEPACPRFGTCGGCTYQNIDYKKQLEIKQKTVKDLLDKADLGEYTFLPAKPSPVIDGYRNKMEFSFGDNGEEGALTLGMRKRNSYYEVVDAGCCKITHPDVCKVLDATIDFFRQTDETFFHKSRHTGSLRHLLVRRGWFTGEMIICLVTTSTLHTDLEKWKDTLLALPVESSIVGICHIINDGVADVVKADKTVQLYGSDCFTDKLLGLDFKISTFSFFQTNSAGAEVLYSTVREFAGSDKCKTIFDLYCGTGTITQLLSQNADTVYGIELVEEAVAAAKENAALNNITNCEFIAGDVLNMVDSLPKDPDLIILDPPREGINPKAIQKIINFNAKKLVYVSCKASSLTKDLLVFKENGYNIEKIQCVDMFPGTYHIETIVLLQKENISKC